VKKRRGGKETKRLGRVESGSKCASGGGSAAFVD